MGNLAATDVVLTETEIAQLEEVSELPSEYPGWMIERQSGNRFPDQLKTD